MKTLYLSDLDGTLLNAQGGLSPFTISALNCLSDRGVMFTVATARTFATVVPMFRDVRLLAPLVLMNGVCLYDPVEKRTIHRHTLDISLAKEAERIFAKYGKNPMLYFEHNGVMRVEYQHLVHPHQATYVAARDNFYNKGFEQVKQYSFDDKDNFVYIVTLDKKEEIEPIYHEMNALPGVTFNFYSDNYTDCYFLEGMSDKASKGNGAKEVKRLLGADRIVVFGDNMNDLPLFEMADESYAVSNACDAVKEKATAVIGSNDDDAVARFLLERLESNKI